MSWTTIESDPGVFTELIEAFGVKSVQVEELFSLDGDSFEALEPVYGLVFLFKYTAASRHAGDAAPAEDTSVFFANQVINNACATQALIHILLNRDDEIDIGPTLSSFKAFTADFPSTLKGEALQESEPIRTAHNSFARPEPFVIEHRTAGDDDDVFHFISYVPIRGAVYELDGLKPGPVRIGAVPESGKWIDVVRPEIQRRIEQYASSEIRFNLLALVKNRKDVLSQERAALETQLEAADDTTTAQLHSEIATKADAIKSEEAKFEQWHAENRRRQHNWIPFIMEAIQAAAEKKVLVPALESARTSVAEAAEARRSKKQTAGVETE